MLKNIDKFVAKLEYGIMMFLMTVLTLILVAQVILRYFFSNPIFWAEDVAVQILAILTCVGISYLIYANDMIKVDLLGSMLPAKTLAIVQRVVYVLAFLVMLVVCFYAIDWVVQPENRFAVSPTTGLPKQYNHLLIIGSFCLMTWHLAVKAIYPQAANS